MPVIVQNLASGNPLSWISFEDKCSFISGFPTTIHVTKKKYLKKKNTFKVYFFFFLFFLLNTKTYSYSKCILNIHNFYWRPSYTIGMIEDKITFIMVMINNYNSRIKCHFTALYSKHKLIISNHCQLVIFLWHCKVIRLRKVFHRRLQIY